MQDLTRSESGAALCVSYTDNWWLLWILLGPGSQQIVHPISWCIAVT